MRRVNLLHAHGSPNDHMHRKHGCRCVACGAARSEGHRKYRAEHAEEIAEAKRQYRAEHTEESSAYHRQYRDEHPKELADYDRKYTAEHPEERRECKNKWDAAHPGLRRLGKYGLDIAAWNELFATQGNRCKCCGTDDPGSKHGWHTDHDHETGALRGILCRGCNIGLGHFRDNPEILMAAIEYLAAATL